MTAPALAASRGRPSVAGLQASLQDARDANGRLREANVNLALELREERRQGRAFADRVRLGVDRIKTLVATGADMAAVNEAGKLGYETDRRLTQIGSVVL